MYGTSVKAVEDVAARGRRCVLDIDSQVTQVCPLPFIFRSSHSSRFQGVKLIKANHPYLNPIYVFLSPPSLADLKARLKGRGTETSEAIQSRLATSIGEIAYAKSIPKPYDVVVVNDDLEKAYEKLRQVCAEDKWDPDDQVIPPLDDDEVQ